MNTRSIVLLPLAALLLLSGCGEAPEFVPGTHAHLMPVASAPRLQTDPNGNPLLQYYGGPVLSNVKVVAVFWGPDVDATTQARIAATSPP